MPLHYSPQIAQSAFFLSEIAHFISFVCVSVPSLKKSLLSQKEEEGATKTPAARSVRCSAALVLYLRTIRLQSLFKEPEMLLISFYCFHLSLRFPFSSLLTTVILLFLTHCYPPPFFCPGFCCCSFSSIHCSKLIAEWKNICEVLDFKDDIAVRLSCFKQYKLTGGFLDFFCVGLYDSVIAEGVCKVCAQ